jgi:hypothetical protein
MQEKPKLHPAKRALMITAEITIRNQAELVKTIVDCSRRGEYGLPFSNALQSLNNAIAEERKAELQAVRGTKALPEMLQLHQADDREVLTASTEMEQEALQHPLEQEAVERSGHQIEMMINKPRRGKPLEDSLITDELLAQEIASKDYKGPIRQRVYRSFSSRQRSVERVLDCDIEIDHSARQRRLKVNLRESIEEIQLGPKKNTGTRLFQQIVHLETAEMYLKSLLNESHPEEPDSIQNIRSIITALERVQGNKKILLDNAQSKIREVRSRAAKTVWADKIERGTVAVGLAAASALLTYWLVNGQLHHAENILTQTLNKVAEYEAIIKNSPAEIANLRAQFISLQSAAGSVPPENFLSDPNLVSQAQRVLEIPAQIAEKSHILEAAQPAINITLKNASGTLNMSEFMAKATSFIGSLTIGISAASFSEVIRNPKNLAKLFRPRPRARRQHAGK